MISVLTNIVEGLAIAADLSTTDAYLIKTTSKQDRAISITGLLFERMRS